MYLDKKKKPLLLYSWKDFLSLGDVLLSQNPAVQVPSALKGLTVVFGMGTRGTPSPSSPNGIFRSFTSKVMLRENILPHNT
jgi:hypothetical protein